MSDENQLTGTFSRDCRTGDSRTGDSRTGDSRTGDSRTGDSRTGDSQPAEALANTGSFQLPPHVSVLGSIAASVGRAPLVHLPDAEDDSQKTIIVNSSSREIPAPGDRSARFQLLGEIARGGMGVVLKGHDYDLGRDLAVKVLLDSHKEKADLVCRFVEEAQIGGQLQHPGVVPVYELGTFGDSRPYFTMKLVKGQTLAELLAARATVAADLPKFVGIFEQVCQTVAYAHSRDVIHRDLKPSNVMVGSFGEVQVMDWGLAKVLPRGTVNGGAAADPNSEQETVISTARGGSESDVSLAGSVIGTLAYMAPEQARGEIDLVDERSDVFALGSVLCEILTGRPAFVGRSAVEIHRHATLGDTANAFSRLDMSGTDSELIALAKHCLAREQVDRPRNAGAVADRIMGYLSGVQERLRAVEIAHAAEQARAAEAEETAKAERKARRLTGALAASVLGLMILAGGGWAYFQHLKTTRREATERVVNQALDEATRLWGQARSAEVEDLSAWTAALNAAKKADGLLAAGEAGPESRDRVRILLAALEEGQADAQTKARELKRDQELLARLEIIRGERSAHFSAARTDADYATAFRDFGIDFEKLEPKAAGKLLAARSAPVDLAGFLDDWVYVRNLLPAETEKDFWRRLNEVARAVDPDPWRDALRAQIRGNDKAALPRLADDQKALEGQPATSLLLLARWLQALGDRPRTEAVLLRAWKLQPDDFWVNDQLGWLYLWGTRLWSPETKPAEAARYYSAAVAVRPKSSVAQMNLGVALCPIRLDQGISALRESIRLNPDSVSAHINLAIGLNEQKKFEEVVDEYREAARLDPDSPLAHEGLGTGLYFLGKLDEAAAAFRKSLKIQPENLKVLNNLAWLLSVSPGREQRDYDDALELSRKAAKLSPDTGMMFGTLALAEYRSGHWAESIAAAERSIALLKGGEAFDWFIMAMAQERKGDKENARKAFEKGFAWMKEKKDKDADRLKIWTEAAELLGQPRPE